MEHKYQGGRMRPENTRIDKANAGLRGWCQTCGKPKSAHFPQPQAKGD